MEKINLAKIIALKRREKGVTQDELAAHVGVSKASVSKWETGLSYPDITCLPILAAYFDISIDQLMGYSQQLDKAGIDKLMQSLSKNFTVEPFDEAMKKCETMTKKYFSCYLLLVKMSGLYLNHLNLVTSEEQAIGILNKVVGLCERAKINSKDANVIYEAQFIEAWSYIGLGNGERVLEILGEPQPRLLTEWKLISQAHQVLGDMDKAKECLQIEVYQSLMVTFDALVELIQLNVEDLEKAESTFLRAEGLLKLFHLNVLNANSVVQFYIVAAQMYLLGGISQKAVKLLSKAVDVCIHWLLPGTMRGDEFFDKLEDWLAEHVGNGSKSESAIKENIMNDILLGSIFESLQGDSEYLKIIQKFETFMKE